MADKTGMKTTDVSVLRELGAWQAAEAASPRNQEEIRAWLAHDAGSPDRRCTDPGARQVERGFRLRRYSVEQVQDDRVVPAYAEYGPQIGSTDFGVPSGIHIEAGADGLASNYQAHLAKTVACAEGCRLEFIQRDVYTTHDQPERFRRWCTLVREAAAVFRP